MVHVYCRQHSHTHTVLKQHGSELDGKTETGLCLKVPASRPAAGPQELDPRHPAACLHGVPAGEVHHGEGAQGVSWMSPLNKYIRTEEEEEIPGSSLMINKKNKQSNRVLFTASSSTGGITVADVVAWSVRRARSVGCLWRVAPATKSECVTSVTPTSTQSKSRRM